MASPSLPTATAVRVCEGEGNSEPTVTLTRELRAAGEVEEPEELKSDMGGERGEPPLLRPHEQVRKNTKLLKAINWTNDHYELCVENRAEQHSGSLFVVFILGETSSGKKFSCVISDKQQESLHLLEGAPLALCGMEHLFHFMEEAFELEKPEFSPTLPEFLEPSVASVGLMVSFDNGLGGWSAVRFQVQVDLALFHNPSEVEQARMVVEKRVGALEDRVAGEVADLRRRLAGANEETNRLREEVSSANEETNRLREEVSSLKQFVLEFHKLIGSGYTVRSNGAFHIYDSSMTAIKNLKLPSSNR